LQFIQSEVFVSSELPGPSSNPIITGGEVGGTTDKYGKQFYKPGDLLNLTCTSAPSNPPATLEWRINGQKVNIMVARFFLLQNTKTGKIYQITSDFTKCP
jgi:hypothetical protein